MFGFKSSRSESAVTHSSRNAGLNIIGDGTSIVGNISASSDIRLDGSLRGDLTSTAKVIIGTTGSITGNISAFQVVIEGNVIGEIVAEDLVTLQNSATVCGGIRTQRLSTGAGCVIDGVCTVTGAVEVIETAGERVSVINLEQQRIGSVAVAG